MIINAFSRDLKEYAASIPASIILTRWLKDILNRLPDNNIEKIIHTELTLLEDDNGMYAIVGTSLNGQKLLEHLYTFVLSYENFKYSRWLHQLKPEDFNKEA